MRPRLLAGSLSKSNVSEQSSSKNVQDITEGLERKADEAKSPMAIRKNEFEIVSPPGRRSLSIPTVTAETSVSEKVTEKKVLNVPNYPIVTKENVALIRLPKVSTKIDKVQQRPVEEMIKATESYPKDYVISDAKKAVSVPLLSPRHRLLPSMNVREAAVIDVQNLVDVKRLGTGRSTKNSNYYDVSELKEIAKKLDIRGSHKKDELVSLIKEKLRSMGVDI